MAHLRVTTLDGPDTILEESTVAAFKKSLRGQLILTNLFRHNQNIKLTV
jgi:hypothetical protein